MMGARVGKRVCLASQTIEAPFFNTSKIPSPAINDKASRTVGIYSGYLVFKASAILFPTN